MSTNTSRGTAYTDIEFTNSTSYASTKEHHLQILQTL